ncbi:DNA sulfur modification protein DndB [Rathayibacter sp. Leaf299]|uniref:DNA sulfur modification protein DndB n=1 Tax=Rathayibacter sp. Leaf299 TaxID=1736328 RepID=UPI000A87E080|nr:DNA sulfur modification protein DndB [Rathayibacter sp. Leaf299]
MATRTSKSEQNAVSRFGSEIEIAHCILGGNLNLSVVRGFARLDLLAAVSRPDVYDQVLNPLGTQRLLEKSHATQAVEYAVSSSTVAADTDPRAFPEIILNARDRSAVSVFSADEDSSELDLISTSPAEFDPRPVNLRIDLDLIASDGSGLPRISRVDGNHRLSQAIPEEGDDLDTFPVVPFALFIGLTDDQERALFRDINGTQKPMQTAHLDTIRLRLEGSSNLLQSEAGRALWLARELSESGRAFEGKVFFGGNTKGPKSVSGKVPPIRINALKGAVMTTLREAPRLEVDFLGIGSETSADDSVVTEEQALQIVVLLDRYWVAVKKAYPVAWQDRYGFVLLQAIGLTAFSRLAGDVITELAYEKSSVQQSDFDLVLSTIAAKVDLARESFPGLAGLAGAKVLYQKLLASMTQSDVNVASVKKQLLGDVVIPSPLDD